MKHMPGPAPTSCITCRQRKKKCDKAQPMCTQCRQGGYRCLGYGRGASPRSRSGSTHPRGDRSSPSEPGLISTFEVVLASPPVVNLEPTPKAVPIVASQESLCLPIFSSSSGPPRYRPILAASHPSHSPSTYDEITPCAFGDNSGAAKFVSDTRNKPEVSRKVRVYDTPDWAVVDEQTGRYITGDSGCFLPPRLIPDPQTSGMTIRFIMSQYESLFSLVFFRPMQDQLQRVRGLLVTRIMSSDIIHWSMYTGAQMFHALQKDGEDADVQRFTPWLDRLGLLSITATGDISLDDLVGRLSGALELAFLKHLTSSAKSCYIMLRQAAPLFMQVAFADPTLWPRDPSSSGISFSHALISPLYEIERFIFIDTITSLTFGTPPLVEYDTSHPITRAPDQYPREWIHGCPLEFLISIAKINQWRARHPNGDSDECSPWEEIEDDIKTWRLLDDCGPDSESSRVVMRFSVQESWRHALFIYLYMGMCGVTSHDTRVQSSVRQISQLHATIDSHSHAEMHVMVPFLLAGACARGEADRRKFWAVVSQSGRRKSGF